MFRNMWVATLITIISLSCLCARGIAAEDKLTEDDWRCGACAGFFIQMARVGASTQDAGLPFFAIKDGKSVLFTDKVALHEYLKVKAVTDRGFDDTFEPTEIRTLAETLKDDESEIPKDVQKLLSDTFLRTTLSLKSRSKSLVKS